MSLKHAVLALLVERRGYGYDLVQRFDERVGPGWRLNPSAVYPALDQLERAGLVAGSLRAGGTRRSPRLIYTATDAATAALDAWMHTIGPQPEPVRSDLHLKLAFARAEHRVALRAELAARERATAELLAGDPRTAPRGGRAGGWPHTAAQLIDDAVVARLQGDIAWLQRVRTAFDTVAPPDPPAR